MNMYEIVKWTFIVIMMAPLPVLLISYTFLHIKQKFEDYYSQDKQGQE